MKNQTAHTPWIYGESNDDGFSNIRDPKSGHRIAQVMGEENAAFIVRAVNAHEELLAIARAVLNGVPSTLLRGGAREAIAKAEGKS